MSVRHLERKIKRQTKEKKRQKPGNPWNSTYELIRIGDYVYYFHTTKGYRRRFDPKESCAQRLAINLFGMGIRF